MTGYGRGEGVLHDRAITVEVRAVNNRYLDCAVKIPRLYVFAEESIKAQVQKQVGRGKVDVLISIDATAADKVAVSLNRSVADGYYTALTQMRDAYNLKDDISVSLLSRFPDVFLVEKEQGDADVIAADLLQVLSQALEGFNAMREREGPKSWRRISGPRPPPSPRWWNRWRFVLRKRLPRIGKSSARGCRKFWKIPRSTRAGFSPRPPSSRIRWPWTRRRSACAATCPNWRICWSREAPLAGSWIF